jgi:hypothetical protein
VDPVPDPLLLRKSGSVGNGTWDLWVCSQELWPWKHRTLYSATVALWCLVSAGWSTPTLWKHCQFLNESKQVDWKRWLPALVLKIPRPNTTGPFAVWLYEEYNLWGENHKSSNFVRLHNRGDCNNDQTYACECVTSYRMSFDMCRATSGIHTETY